MRHAKRISFVAGWVLVVLVLACVVTLHPAKGWGRTDQSAFFSQGQAPYDPQNRDKCRQDAVREFQAQALTQAVGTFLNPSQMGTKIQQIRDKVLRQPERYVDAYQVFSENAEGGFYKVAGQVTVAMGLLKKDLIAFGIYTYDEGGEDDGGGGGKGASSRAGAEKPMPPASGVEPGSRPEARPMNRVEARPADRAGAGPGDRAGDTDEDTDTSDDDASVGIQAGARDKPRLNALPGAGPGDQAEDTEEVTEEVKEETAEEPADEPADEAQGGTRAGTEPGVRAGTEPGVRAGTEPGARAGTEPGARAGAPPEAGEEAPVPAGGRRGIGTTSREIFWAVPEKWDQDWYLPEDLRDPRGLFAASLVQELLDYHYTLQLPAAGSLKVDNTGNVSSTQAVTQAKAMGIRNVVVGRVVLQRGRKEPARLEAELQVIDTGSGKSLGKIRKVRNLEEMTNQESAMELAGDVTNDMTGMLSPGGQATGSETPVPVAAAGEWILKIRVDDQHVYWREMEKLLKEQARGMVLLGMEMGPQETMIRLGGIDERALNSLNGRALPGGVTIRIEGLSAESRTTNVSFVPQGMSQPGPKQ